VRLIDTFHDVSDCDALVASYHQPCIDMVIQPPPTLPEKCVPAWKNFNACLAPLRLAATPQS